MMWGRLMKAPLEEVEQKALVQYLRLNKIPHFAIPNGGKRNAIEMKNMKTAGLKVGASDMVIMLPNKILFIELKRSDPKLSKVSKEQKAFLKEVNKLDYAYGDVAFGYLEAIEIIEEFICD